MGYTNRFIPLHNGSLFCTEDGEYYSVDDFDFLEINVESTNAILLRLEAADGMQGFILQQRN